MRNQERIILDSTERKLIAMMQETNPLMASLTVAEIGHLVLTDALIARIKGQQISYGESNINKDNARRAVGPKHRLVERQSIDFVGREDRYDAVFSRVLKSHGGLRSW